MEKHVRLTVEQYLNYVKNNLQREITELHRHHTWRPNYDTWNKAKDKREVMVAMEVYHKSLGWRDIGQNATLDPDGYVWSGRDLNTTPASVKGRNTGAWALEMIGDFDKDRDRMTVKQDDAMVKLFAGMRELTGATIIDHNEFSEKTCPGSALDKEGLLKAIEILKNPEEEAWKSEGVIYLAEEGLLHDKEGWMEKINEPMPVWGVCLLLKKLHESLK